MPMNADEMQRGSRVLHDRDAASLMSPMTRHSWFRIASGRCLFAAAMVLTSLILIASTPMADDHKVKTLPTERGGQDLVGSLWPALTFDAWLATQDNEPVDRDDQLTLYRWWTDGCPYC